MAEIVESSPTALAGGALRVYAADGALAVQVSHAALESLRTGRSITC